VQAHTEIAPGCCGGSDRSQAIKLGFGLMAGADNGLERLEVGARLFELAMQIFDRALMLEVERVQISPAFGQRGTKAVEMGAKQAATVNHRYAQSRAVNRRRDT